MGVTFAIQCHPGYYSVPFGPIEKCPGNYCPGQNYQPAPAQTKCLTCPDDTISKKTYCLFKDAPSSTKEINYYFQPFNLSMAPELPHYFVWDVIFGYDPTDAKSQNIFDMKLLTFNSQVNMEIEGASKSGDPVKNPESHARGRAVTLPVYNSEKEYAAPYYFAITTTGFRVQESVNVSQIHVILPQIVVTSEFSINIDPKFRIAEGMFFFKYKVDRAGTYNFSISISDVEKTNNFDTLYLYVSNDETLQYPNKLNNNGESRGDAYMRWATGSIKKTMKQSGYAYVGMYLKAVATKYFKFDIKIKRI